MRLFTLRPCLSHSMVLAHVRSQWVEKEGGGHSSSVGSREGVTGGPHSISRMEGVNKVAGCLEGQQVLVGV